MDFYRRIIISTRVFLDSKSLFVGYMLFACTFGIIIIENSFILIAERFIHMFYAIAFPLWGMTIVSYSVSIENLEGFRENYSSLPHNKAMELIFRLIISYTLVFSNAFTLLIIINYLAVDIDVLKTMLIIIKPTILLSSLSLLGACIFGDMMLGIGTGAAFWMEELLYKANNSKLLCVYSDLLVNYPYSYKLNNTLVYLFALIFIVISIMIYSNKYYFKVKHNKYRETSSK